MNIMIIVSPVSKYNETGETEMRLTKKRGGTINQFHSLLPHNPAIRFLSMPAWHIAEVPPLPAGIDIQYQLDYQR